MTSTVKSECYSLKYEENVKLCQDSIRPYVKTALQASHINIYKNMIISQERDHLRGQLVCEFTAHLSSHYDIEDLYLSWSHLASSEIPQRVNSATLTTCKT